MVRRGFRLPAAERARVLEALIALAWARLLFAVLPFQAVMARLRLRLQSGDPRTVDGCAPTPASTIAAVGCAVRRGGRVAPFRAVCLQEAVAAMLMLRRRGLPSEVHFGVVTESASPLHAHAWSVCCGVVVTGERAMNRFTRIAVFRS